MNVKVDLIDVESKWSLSEDGEIRKKGQTLEQIIARQKTTKERQKERKREWKKDRRKERWKDSLT